MLRNGIVFTTCLNILTLYTSRLENAKNSYGGTFRSFKGAEKKQIY